MTIDKVKLKALAEAAPEGPWFGPEYAPGTSYVFDVDLGTLLEYQSIDSEKDACLRYVEAANPAAVLALLAEIDQLKAEVDRLKGLQPTLPPRPPEGYGLPRFGLRWNGPSNPLAVSMDDGYWTPWHLAAELLKDAERFRFVVDCPIRTMVALSRKTHESDFDLGSECDQLMSKIASKKTGD